MANTYTQLYIHYIFAVQNRICLIKDNFKNDLYKYMNGIIVQQGYIPNRNRITNYIKLFLSV
jgi:hypothetical protein